MTDRSYNWDEYLIMFGFVQDRYGQTIFDYDDLGYITSLYLEKGIEDPADYELSLAELAYKYDLVITDSVFVKDSFYKYDLEEVDHDNLEG